MKYAVVIPARNEERYIGKTLSALRKQTIPPSQIIVVDDGSRDKTLEIAMKNADLTIHLQDRGYGALGRPELAKVISEGLDLVGKDVDYVLICGADARLPPDFFEKISTRMKENPKLVIASGRVEGQSYHPHSPRGTRIVEAKFWKELNGMQYPIVWGWEPWLFYKAMQLGFEVKAFADITIKSQRRRKNITVDQAKAGGKLMYTLGYYWLYALGRCILFFIRNPKNGWHMFWSWIFHKNLERLDVADWVNQMQKTMFWKRFQVIVKHGGRK